MKLVDSLLLREFESLGVLVRPTLAAVALGALCSIILFFCGFYLAESRPALRNSEEMYVDYVVPKALLISNPAHIISDPSKHHLYSNIVVTSLSAAPGQFGIAKSS